MKSLRNFLKPAEFDAFAEEFSASRTIVWPEMKLFAADLKPADQVLEIGCGNGKNMSFFLECQAEATGLDISSKLIGIARQQFPNNIFVQADMRRLPFATGQFDAVFAIASLHHLRTVSARRQAVSEALRVTKAGGLFCGTVWNLHQDRFAELRDQAARRTVYRPWRSMHDLWVPWGSGQIPRFYHAFTPEELEALLSAAGFTEIELFAESAGQKVEPLAGKNICFRACKPKRVHILGVPFDMPTYADSLSAMHGFAAADRQIFITTPNPEICVAATRLPDYAKVLGAADFSVPDGIGILWAGEYLHSPGKSLAASIIRFALAKRSRFFPDRVSGADLFHDFCATSTAPIFLLGGASGVADACAQYFRQKGAQVVGTDSGKASEDDEARIVEKIVQSGAEVLFVAFGAPKQEQWILKNLGKMPNIRLAMGIGGSFDFVAGTQKRAPALIRRLGLEWAWRLIREPSRRQRIFTAVFTFPRLIREEKKERKQT